MRGEASGVWARFAKSFTFNNAELLIRIPIVALMVSGGHISAVIATAITLIVAFIVRFVFHSLVVYAPRKPGAQVEPGAPHRRRARRAGDVAGRALADSACASASGRGADRVCQPISAQPE